MSEALYLVALYSIGFLFAASWLSSIGTAFVVGASMVLGQAILLLAILPLLLLGWSYTATSFALLLISLLALGTLVVSAHLELLCARHSRRELLLWYIGGLLAVAAISLAAQAHAALGFGSDSYVFLAMARSLAWSGGLNDFVAERAATYPMFLVVAQSPAWFLGNDALFGLLPCFAASILTMVFGVVTRGDYRRAAFFAAVVAVVTLIMVPQFQLHAAYLMPNLPAAALVTLVTAVFFANREVDNEEGLLAVSVALAALVLCRLEGPIFCAVLCAIFVTDKPSILRAKAIVTSPPLLTGAVWFGFLAVTAGATGTADVLPFGALAQQIGILLGGVILAVIAHWKLEFARRLVNFLPIVLLCLFAIVFALRPQHAWLSTSIFLSNLTHPAALNGYFWLVVLPVWLALAWDMRHSPEMRLFLIAIPTLFVATILLGLVRTIPYRLGSQDSGNRILLQIMPVVAIGIGCKLRAIFSHCHASQNQDLR